ncbi:hypothetical protein HF086_009489 [Spodoptera exigua]|uniref:Uncharacterized protein n=1 Tax=Spodoptera exigua TaxID=7107 RepID=A0A922SFD9_SPOEX|nr:hypothetical protein HF086_009489 [Spodoptera exigua]
MEVVGVCRCCLTQGLNKDLHSIYHWLDKKEIYAEMLLECFNIVVSSQFKFCTKIVEVKVEPKVECDDDDDSDDYYLADAGKHCLTFYTPHLPFSVSYKSWYAIHHRTRLKVRVCL